MFASRFTEEGGLLKGRTMRGTYRASQLFIAIINVHVSHPQSNFLESKDFVLLI